MRKQLLTFTLRKGLLTFALVVFLVPWPLGARADTVPPPTGPSAELLANETRRRVTDELKRALEEKCPQQCDVGEVTVRVQKRKPVVGSTPGFEELTPDVKDFLVERVDVDLMLDKKLGNDYRAGLKTLLSKKLAAEGIASDLHENLIHFPQPQEQADKPPVAPPPLIIKNESDRREQPATQLVMPPGPSAWERFIESLPLLLGLVLCAGVVWFTLRQYQRVLEGRLSAKVADEEKALVGEDAASRKKSEESRELQRRLDTLVSRLAHKPLAQAVAQDLLESGAVADVALSVTLLGPSLFDGVRRDPECRRGLDALDDYLAERAPPDSPEDRRRVVSDLERRLLRVQVRHGEQPVEPAFAFLRDVKSELFVRLLGSEPPEIQALILRHAPPPLVQAFVERRSPEERERLVRPLLSSTTVSRESAEKVAEAFAEKLSQHLVAEHPDPIGDLLQAAPADERRRILQGLVNDPEALRAALRSFVADETLHALDGDVLAAAVARLDTATAARFAGALDVEARERLYSALPKVTARAIAEEVDATVSSPALRAVAWKSALKAIRGAVEERGLDLAEMNKKGLKTGASS